MGRNEFTKSSTSDLLGIFGKGGEMLQAIANPILNFGGSDETLCQLLKDGEKYDKLREEIGRLMMLASFETATIEVCHGRILSNWIQAIGFRDVDKRIPADHMCPIGTRLGVRRVYFVKFEYRISELANSLLLIQQLGLDLPSLAEGFETIKQHPDIVKRFPIILAKETFNVEGKDHIIEIWPNGKDRELRLKSSDDNYDYWTYKIRPRILAVEADPK